jgi:hypothetical protein
MDKIRKLLAEHRSIEAQFNSRRHFIKDCTLGLGGLALGGFLNSCSNGSTKIPAYTINRSLNPMVPIPAPFLPKVKSVIYLHMVGAPSQLELFDYKPELAKLHNQACPTSLLDSKKFAFIQGVPNMLGPQATF